MSANAAPVVRLMVPLPGNALGIVSVLSAEQSRAPFTSIGRGSRVEMELVHPELDPDVTTNTKKIYSGGFTQVFLAIHEHCPDFR